MSFWVAVPLFFGGLFIGMVVTFYLLFREGGTWSSGFDDGCDTRRLMKNLEFEIDILRKERKKKYCCTCKFHKEDGSCCYDEHHPRWTEFDDICKHWEGTEEF